MKLLPLIKAMFHLIKTILVAVALLGLTAVMSNVKLEAADKQHILLQSTTSTLNSGLYDSLLPAFTQNSGIEVRVVAVGYGQALRNAANCDGDLVLAHAPEDEKAFMAKGFGARRLEIMQNRFVLLGPAGDPAKIKGATAVSAALRAIATSGARFCLQEMTAAPICVNAVYGQRPALTSPPHLAAGIWKPVRVWGRALIWRFSWRPICSVTSAPGSPLAISQATDCFIRIQATTF